MERLITSVNMADQAFEQLREAILSGEISQGSLHSISEFAEILNISRTPVREAMVRLTEIGLVSIERNRGIRIRRADLHEIRSIFEMRLLLEVPAAAVAATQADPDTVTSLRMELNGMHTAASQQDAAAMAQHHRRFHDLIDGTLNNQILNQVVRSFRDSARARSMTAAGTRDFNETALEHAPILDGIAAKDPRSAAAAMREHLVISGTLLLEQVAYLTGETAPADWATKLFTEVPL